MPYKKPYRKTSWKKPNNSEKNVSPKSTSWEKSSQWYNKIVDTSGHYYHEHTVIPGVLKLLNLKNGDRLLDLACGQGVLARHLPKGVAYLGLDAAPSLIAFAKRQNKNSLHQFTITDVTKPLSAVDKNFTHATIILALQNIEEPARVLREASQHLVSGGQLIIVFNHPCFRIPRQSGWDINPQNKLQYRWVSRYMSPMKIPVKMHPSQAHSETTWTFHHPLSVYAAMLRENNFLINSIEEWVSDKESIGKMAKTEDRGRAEIPLFLAIQARKG